MRFDMATVAYVMYWRDDVVQPLSAIKFCGMCHTANQNTPLELELAGIPASSRFVTSLRPDNLAQTLPKNTYYMLHEALYVGSGIITN